MMKAKTTHQNRFLKILTIPIKALAKARDFYVRSMNNYADRVYCGPYGGSGWVGPSSVDNFPRSLSSTSTRSGEKEDYKELVRAVSTSTLGNRVDLGSALSNSTTRNASTSNTSTSALLLEQRKGNLGGFKAVPRSVSVGMAKIEEDKPTPDFGETDYRHAKTGNIKKKMRLFPRSKSVAVS